MKDAVTWANDPANFEEVIKIYTPLISFGEMQDADALRRNWIKSILPLYSKDLKVDRKAVAAALEFHLAAKTLEKPSRSSKSSRTRRREREPERDEQQPQQPLSRRFGMSSPVNKAGAGSVRPRPAAGSVVLENVSVEFKAAGVLAVSDFSLSVAPGEFVSIVGPSGCGKTTLLNFAAGLLPADVGSGTFLVGGKPPVIGNRDIAYMLARDALSPWRTALGNAELGVEIRGMPAEERRQRALDLLEKVGLKGFENAYPKALSQGMRQRVALARTFCLESPDPADGRAVRRPRCPDQACSSRTFSCRCGSATGER